MRKEEQTRQTERKKKTHVEEDTRENGVIGDVEGDLKDDGALVALGLEVESLSLAVGDGEDTSGLLVGDGLEGLVEGTSKKVTLEVANLESKGL